MMPINLIPKERMLARRARHGARAWAVALSAYAALGAAVCLVVSVPVSADAPKARLDLERLATRLDRAQKDRAAQEKTATESRNKLAAARAVGEHPDWSLLLESMSRARAGEIVLEACDLSTQKIELPAPKAAAGATPDAAGAKTAKPRQKTAYVVKMTGYASAPGGVFGYARRLEGLGVFDQVSVKDTRASMLGSMPTTRFEIVASVQEQGEASR